MPMRIVTAEPVHAPSFHGRARRAYRLLLLHGPLIVGLVQRWPLPADMRLQRHGALGSGRLEDCFHHSNVAPALFAGRLWLSSRQNAVGEVVQLRRELVASLEGFPFRLVSTGQMMDELSHVFVGGLDSQIAFGAGDAIARYAGNA